MLMIKVGFMLIFQGLFFTIIQEHTLLSQLFYLQVPDLRVAHVHLCVYQGVWHQYGGGV